MWVKCFGRHDWWIQPIPYRVAIKRRSEGEFLADAFLLLFIFFIKYVALSIQWEERLKQFVTMVISCLGSFSYQWSDAFMSYLNCLCPVHNNTCVNILHMLNFPCSLTWLIPCNIILMLEPFCRFALLIYNYIETSCVSDVNYTNHVCNMMSDVICRRSVPFD